MDFYAYNFILLNTKLLNVIYSKTWKSQMVPSGTKEAIYCLNNIIVEAAE